MCKIITIINNKPSQISEANEFIKIVAEALTTQQDGMSKYQDGKVYNKLSRYGEKEYLIQSPFEVVNIHTRIATGGSREEEGLHNIKIGGYYCSHNGIVGSYAGVKDKSDSYYYFSELMGQGKHIPRLDEIQKLSGDRSFSGKGVIIGSSELVWYCNQPSYIYRLSDDAIAITSWQVSSTVKRKIEYPALGVAFYKESSEVVELPMDIKVDDIYLRWTRDKNGKWNLKDEEDFKAYKKPPVYFNHNHNKKHKSRGYMDLWREELKLIEQEENEINYKIHELK